MNENEVNENNGEQQTAPVVNQEANQNTSGNAMNDNLSNINWWNMLSYLGILWLVTMFACPNKNDKDVRFHMGQGMLVTIVLVAVNIINTFIISNIFTSVAIWGSRVTSGFGYAMMNILNLIPVVFAIIGMINVYKGEEKELPIIGKFAFYK